MKLPKPHIKFPKINLNRLKLRFKTKPTFTNTTNKEQITLKESLRSPEIRKKILITLGLIFVYRVLAAVPLPGIDTELFAEAFGNNPLTNFFSIVTGGRLDNPSVVAIGLGAYINASIVLQLLTSIIPKLNELSKEGERGRALINQYTRLLAVPLTVVQAVVIYTVLKSVTASVPQLAGLLDNITTFDIVTMVISLTAGSMVLMWLGELITEHGIGNGISIIITISILTVVPNLVARDFSFLTNDIDLLKNGNFNILLNDNFTLIYFFIIGFYLLILSIVYINEAVRKVPIQYARRFRAAGVQANYLPLKLNQAGVMPVIFASALLSFPQIIAQLILGSANSDSALYRVGLYINNSFLGNRSSFLQSGHLLKHSAYYLVTFFVMIVIFAFFYTFVTYKPYDTADNLKKSGGFIPGLRPGKVTQDYITKVLIRLTVVGSLFLATIAIFPNLARLTPQGSNLAILSGIGGTSILIVVGVVLDTIRQMKSLTVTRSYEQYK